MAIGVAVGFADAARRTGRYATLFLALLHAGLSVLGSLVLLRWLQHPPRLLILNPMCLGALMVPLGLGVIVRFARDERLPARRVVAVAAGVIALALPLIVLSLEAYRFFEAHAGGGDAPVKAASAAVSVTWALYAATVLALGISFRNRAMRLGALFLLATTLCKVVFSDFSELDRLARIVSFIALGVVLMIGAWAYHRFASRIFPEKRA